MFWNKVSGLYDLFENIYNRKVYTGTGEKVAGFKNKTDGHFTEVMLIRSPADEKEFKETYGVEALKVEY